ncbi:hypothetical protein BsWGS_20599 [Bradybaena similaris]
MQRHMGQSPAKSSLGSTDKVADLVDGCGDTGAGSADSLAEGKRCEDDVFHQLFGFRVQDLTSWDRFVRLLCRPTDPASIGTLRVFFGFIMILDVIEERGMAFADSWWGSEEECRFPLFDFLQPLPLQWMYVVYLIMLSGAIGMMLGFKMRLSSMAFLATYWYIFFVDKTSWNNHSYLFGILGFLFAISDANRYWSLDGLLNPSINNAHVPLWNYTLIRAQMIIVYFIAGLKKLDMDWVSGYSMQSLSTHPVFYPFKILLTEPQIDLYIVHLGGLFIDLLMGFFLFFDKTREFGLIVTVSFHLMNSQLFSIGMFPWAMVMMQFILCNTNWPRKFFKKIPSSLRLFTPEEVEFQPSLSCVYPKDCVKSETNNSKYQMAYSEIAPPTSPRLKHKIASLFTILFVAWQFFLPYSHGITKGYNNWTNGLYGYSWDMMVHSWSVQHIRISYYDKDTGHSGYLNPKVWTGGSRRWSSHGDMIKQHAHCIANNLRKYNITNVALYFDVWKSLNDRFQQRMVDPRVDIVTADWNPFLQPSWLMPLMVDLSDWRTKLEEIRMSLDTKEPVEVVFVADFPGMHLENYVQPDYGNTSITVLAGQVIVELMDPKKNITLGPDQSVQIRADSFHNVHTVSQVPSCYMYMYVNTTEASFMQKYSQFEKDYYETQSLNETVKKHQEDPDVAQYQKMLESEIANNNAELLQSMWREFTQFLKIKYHLLRRSIRLSTGAVYCLLTNNSFHEFLNATYEWEASLGMKKLKEV